MSAPPVVPARSKGISISRRSEADASALEAMYVEVFGQKAADKNRARWRWQYDRNPNRPPEGPEIWVAKEDGEVLGQYASMPVALLVNGKTLKASWGMDVMVRPNLQRKGVGSRLFLYWDQQVEASLGLGLSLASYTLFKKLQWEDVGPVPCYSRPLDLGPALTRHLGGPLGRLLAPFAAGLVWLALPQRKTRLGGKGIEVSRLEGEFGADFDELWDRVAPAFDFIAERRSNYLQWKYREIPYVDYEVFETRRNNELTGYGVVRIAERNGMKLALLVDWLVHPEDEASAGVLLDQVLAWAKAQGAARVQSFTFDERLASRLVHKGFMRISSPMQFCLQIHSDHVGSDFFRDTSRWHVTFGDSDQDRER